MNYEGEKFLLKLYRELYKEESVKHSGTKSDDKFELVRKYLERLENTDKVFTREKAGAVNYLKNKYYDKYVIKEEDIPESYYELKERIALERGEGYVKYDKDMKHQEAMKLINSQKDSLDKWLNYLMKENTTYPMWARYWAFQSMLKLGKYDKEKHAFTKRSKKTVSPFVELNPEALALTMGTIVKYYQENEIVDEELENIIKSGNFSKLYAYNIWKTIEAEKNNLDNKIDTTEGIWKEYEEGMYKEIIHDIEGKATGWCIAEESTAREYSEMGKMYIYYTKDKNGNFAIPRICIRLEYDNIEEVRGIDFNQNMEPEMLEIVDKKLDEFPDKKRYEKKMRDMKKLTEIYNKHFCDKELSKEDLMFLYEVDDEIIGFGWSKDPRIDEIIKQRNTHLDIISLFKDAIIISNGEVFKYLTSTRGLENLREIEGNANFSNVKSVDGLVNLRRIGGSADFCSLVSAKGLENLQEIGENADFSQLVTADGLKKLEKIGKRAIFSNLTSAKGLENLKEIGGSANFVNLISAKGLENLKEIGGDVNFINLKNAEGLENLKEIGGYVNFANLESAKGLENLKVIGEGVNFNNLTSAKGLENLKEIGGRANFVNLTSAEGLENLKEIGGSANFVNLTSAKGLEKLEKIVGFVDFSSLTTAEGLESLEKISYGAKFTNLKDAKGLHNLTLIGCQGIHDPFSRASLGDLNVSFGVDFSSLTSAEGLENLEKIVGSTDFSSLIDSKGLKSLKIIGDDSFKWYNKELIDSTIVDFSSLTSAEGLENLEKIIGLADFSSLMDLKGLDNLKEIKGNANFSKFNNISFSSDDNIVNNSVGLISKLNVCEKSNNIVNQRGIEKEKSKLLRAKQIMIDNYRKQGLTDEQIEEQLSKLPKHV